MRSKLTIRPLVCCNFDRYIITSSYYHSVDNSNKFACKGSLQSFSKRLVSCCSNKINIAELHSFSCLCSGRIQFNHSAVAGTFRAPKIQISNT